MKTRVYFKIFTICKANEKDSTIDRMKLFDEIMNRACAKYLLTGDSGVPSIKRPFVGSKSPKLSNDIHMCWSCECDFFQLKKFVEAWEEMENKMELDKIKGPHFIMTFGEYSP